MYDHDIRREEKKKSDDYKQSVTFKKKDLWKSAWHRTFY